MPFLDLMSSQVDFHQRAAQRNNFHPARHRSKEGDARHVTEWQN